MSFGFGARFTATLFTAGGTPVSFTTWNPADKNANIALSGGDLQTTALNTAWKSVRAVSGKNAGKWYWEITVPDDLCVFGLADSTALILDTYVGNVGNSGSMTSGTYGWAAGVFTFAGSIPPGGNTAGTYCLACDLDSRKMWVRKAGGAWANGNPGTPDGVASLSWSSALTLFPAMSPYASGGTATANFGDTPFADTAPSGFNAGWTS